MATEASADYLRPLMVNDKEGRGATNDMTPVKVARQEAPVQAIAVGARSQPTSRQAAMDQSNMVNPPVIAQQVEREGDEREGDIPTMAQASAVYYDETAPHLRQLRENNQMCVGVGVCFINIGRLHLTGQVVVPKKINRVLVLHGSKIDLTQAQFVFKDTFISIVVVLGGCKIMIPPGVHVKMNGIAILGGNHEENPSAQSVFALGQPTLHIRAVTILGGVHVSTNVSTPCISKVN